MSHPSFEKWRSISKGTMPTRFESSLNKFRCLSEAKKPRRPGDGPDRRIEVDTFDTVANSPNSLNMAQALEDPREVEKERIEARDRQLQFIRTRLNTLQWIKKQARKDFNMVGGVSPSGAMGGSGGMDGVRPVSLNARS